METIFNGIRYPKCQPSDCHALAIHSWIYHSICVFNSPRIFSWILKWAIVYAIRYQYALQIVQAFQAFLFSVFFLSWMNSQLIFESHIFSLVDIFKINDGIFPHWNNGFFSMFSFIFFFNIASMYILISHIRIENWNPCSVNIFAMSGIHERTDGFNDNKSRQHFHQIPLLSFEKKILPHSNIGVESFPLPIFLKECFEKKNSSSAMQINFFIKILAFPSG